LQADGCPIGVPSRVERERDGVEGADPVAEEPADGTGLAVIDEYLQARPGIAAAAQHDAGVRRPFGIGFESQLEVAVFTVGDQVPAVPRSFGLLSADDDPVLYTPRSRMGIRVLLIVTREIRGHVEHVGSTRVPPSVVTRDRAPPGEADSVK
jgi:hypothetical protein